MSNIIPFGKLKSNNLIVNDKKSSNELMPISMGITGVQHRSTVGTVLHVKQKNVEIDGELIPADPHDLISMIKSITQEIGDYKKQNNLMAKYKVAGLRKIRQSMVSDLQKFGIHWEVDKVSGESIFWL